jgi:hypothetical protein
MTMKRVCSEEREWHNMTRTNPEGVHKIGDQAHYTEFYASADGLKNLVAILQDDVTIKVPPLVSTSFEKLARAGWCMRAKHHNVLTARGQHLKRVQVRFYLPGTGTGMSVRLDRRSLIRTIWDVVDLLQDRELVVKSKLRDLPVGEHQRSLTQVAAVAPQPVLDEFELLKRINDARYAELSKRPRKPVPALDLSNVISIDDYLQATQEKPADTTELDQRVAKALSG